MRRVLVVSYFFPPVGGIGIERVLKHVTYLPEFGWQPAVVAPENSGYRIVDPATLERVPPGTEVHRARSLEPSHIRGAVARLFGKRPRTSGAPAAAPTGEALAPPGPMRLANEAWRRAVPLIFFPDDQVFWLPGAVRAGLEADARNPVDVVFSSSPPITSHLAAGRISGRIGVPWVADFRDPWIGNAFAPPLPAPYRAVQRRMERWIVSKAARVVLATGRMVEQYADRYPGLADRFVHLPNGYDLAELEAVAAAALAKDDAAFPVDRGLRELRFAGDLAHQEQGGVDPLRVGLRKLEHVNRRIEAGDGIGVRPEL